jgi:hypothetical protein
MKYPDGNDVKLHDLIWWNEGMCLGFVSLIVETEEQWGKWGLDEPGIFFSFDLSGKTFGQHMFNSEESFVDEAIGLLTEAETTEIKALFPKVCQFDPEVVERSYSLGRHFNRGGGWIICVYSDDPKKPWYYGISETGEVKRLAREETFYRP